MSSLEGEDFNGSNGYYLGLSQSDISSSRPVTSMRSSNDVTLKKIFADLCLASRSGDLETVDTLLSTPGLDVNQVDEWDYSPLILASICGHLNIVELLLQRGAVCDRDTFQGARCVYGALTDQIRDLLVSFDISKKVDSSQPFASHISSLLNPINGINSKDVIFHFPQTNPSGPKNCEPLALNKFLLIARSCIFEKAFKDEWKGSSLIELGEINYEAFKVIVDYIYLRTDTIPIESPQLTDQISALAIKFELYDLLEGIEMIKKAKNDKDKAKIKHEVSFRLLEKARKDMDVFLESKIVNQKLTVDLNHLDEIDPEEIDVNSFITETQKSAFLSSDTVTDAILATLDEDTGSINYYPVHKSIITRSEYFETMMKSDIFLTAHPDPPKVKYRENNLELDVFNRSLMTLENLPVIQISTSCTDAKVAEVILSFLYHDDVKDIPKYLSVELLYAADELFLDKLKSVAAVNITSSITKFSVDEFEFLEEIFGYDAYDMIRISWKISSEKLEQHITKLIAYNLDYIFGNSIEKEKLNVLVQESALRIEERQETDTIELIDDMRYYLGKKYAIGDQFEDLDAIGTTLGGSTDPEDILIVKKSKQKYEQDNDLIEDLLADLGLDA